MQEANNSDEILEEETVNDREFNSQMFENSLAIFLLLISTLIPLWSESRHCMISILLNLFWCVLWPRRWSVLVRVPREREKNV